ncbi:hypothetical protein [Spiroplasma poulsonii]|uniref:Uncharacterized protein n=1 Tax=Spiroplasma poulsonii TaxID=2138 RepID=A0A0C2EKH0_9MOLU|nr:hypothetical protein [Spiroplasma poulsonii]KAF0850667.1 Chaperone protein ClpB [Spiroplasma poulsonii]KAF0850685.1 Chaperone protein ClpB [Spiroplasma poulsonii]PQM31677.1 hypothetical protein SMSRO_SF015280 [Spiroplasma poulsonii]PQM31695.1 hypothetical protein SMSRO_SF015460 [Spiroplasma poulsonii]PWF96708.1 hypothetical protein SMSE_21550 [Spiroplasma poulsonii]
MKYLVMLTKVNKNKVIKNNKTGKEDYYDVLKFQPLEKNENGEYESSNLLPKDKWFKQDNENYIRFLALLVKKLQIFVKKILIEKYNFN